MANLLAWSREDVTVLLINENGQAHELTFSCCRRFPLLSKHRTCEWLAASIRAACADLEFSLWAFVFMPDHVHMIVHPTRSVYDVSDFLAAIKQPTSRRALAFLRKESPQWIDKLTVGAVPEQSIIFGNRVEDSIATSLSQGPSKR